MGEGELNVDFWFDSCGRVSELLAGDFERLVAFIFADSFERVSIPGLACLLVCLLCLCLAFFVRVFCGLFYYRMKDLEQCIFCIFRLFYGNSDVGLALMFI